MALSIDYERLIMTGVLIAALVLWGGVLAEASGLHPKGEELATAALGFFIFIFVLTILALRILKGPPDEKPNA